MPQYPPNITQPGSGSFNNTNPGPVLKDQSTGAIQGISPDLQAWYGVTTFKQEKSPAVQPDTLTATSPAPAFATCLIYSALEQTTTNQRDLTDALIGNPLLKSPLTDMSMSEDGDLATTSRSLVPSGTILTLDYLTVAATQQNKGNGWTEQSITKVSNWGWMYASLIDAETGIVGNVAKTFVPNSQGNVSGQYLGPTTINGKLFGALNVGYVEMTNNGTGYTSAPAVVFTGGGAGVTTPAAGTAILGGGGILLITVTNGGSGYTSIPTVTFNGVGGSGATVGTFVIVGGSITSLIVGNPGINYPSGTTVSITGGGGIGATATCTVSPIGVASVEITNPGVGYSSAPAVTFTGGGGANAAGTAILGEDLVVVEFQEYDTLKQILLVTVFSAGQIFGLSEVTEIVGSYPVPPKLLGITGYNDTATATGSGSGSNYMSKLDTEWSGEVAPYFQHPPTKMSGQKIRTYYIGPVPAGEIPPATIFLPVSGSVVIEGGSFDVSQSTFADDSGAGESNNYGTSVRYKIEEIPPCINSITQFNFPNGGQTNSATNSGGSSAISVSSAATFSTNMQSSSPPSWPTEIIEYATAKGRYEIYMLDVITWNLP